MLGIRTCKYMYSYLLKINASKSARGVPVKNTPGIGPRRAFLGSTWSYSKTRTWGRNPIAKKLRCGRTVGYAKYFFLS
jgi:hypothetical protein